MKYYHQTWTVSKYNQKINKMKNLKIIMAIAVCIAAISLSSCGKKGCHRPMDMKPKPHCHPHPTDSTAAE